MDIHKNARLTPHNRAQLVRRVRRQRQAPTAVAFGVSVKMVGKWIGRFQAEGVLGLRDRTSRTCRLRAPTSQAAARRIEALRRQRWTATSNDGSSRTDDSAWIT